MSELDEVYPGVGRLNYFLGKVGIIAAVIFVVTVFGPNSGVMRIVGLLVSIASFVLDVKRLQNIGVSQWFAMLRFIPYVNLVYMIALLSAQGGWNETRRLDRSGKTIAAFMIALAALMFFMIMRMRISMPYLLW
jgi:uncharacterized membrane protein YhaH (DUF805 family)